MERTKRGPTNPSSSKSSRPVRYQSNLIQDIYTSNSRRLGKINNGELFFLSVLGGGFITLGTLVATMLNMEVTASGAQFLLITLGLTAGYLFVVLTNAVLFSEGNVYVPANFYNYTLGESWLRIAKFWLISWIGNVIGAIIIAFLVYLAPRYSDTFIRMITALSAGKLAHVQSMQYHGTGEILVSGMLAAWVISIVTYAALASRNLINQFIIIFLGVLIITTANFQFFPFNLGFFALNVFLGQSAGLVDILVLNLLPVSIGNILGATILVAWPLLYLQRRRK